MLHTRPSQSLLVPSSELTLLNKDTLPNGTLPSSCHFPIHTACTWACSHCKCMGTQRWPTAIHSCKPGRCTTSTEGFLLMEHLFLLLVCTLGSPSVLCGSVPAAAACEPLHFVSALSKINEFNSSFVEVGTTPRNRTGVVRPCLIPKFILLNKNPS